MISHERKTVTLDWQIQSHSLGHRSTKVSHGIIERQFLISPPWIFSWIPSWRRSRFHRYCNLGKINSHENTLPLREPHSIALSHFISGIPFLPPSTSDFSPLINPPFCCMAPCYAPSHSPEHALISRPARSLCLFWDLYARQTTHPLCRELPGVVLWTERFCQCRDITLTFSISVFPE